MFISRLLKNAHLLRFPDPSPCQARGRLVAAYDLKYALFARSWGLRISGALHLGIFEQPEENGFFSKLLEP